MMQKLSIGPISSLWGPKISQIILKAIPWTIDPALIIFSYFIWNMIVDTMLVIKDFNFRLVLESIYTEITATRIKLP